MPSRPPTPDGYSANKCDEHGSRRRADASALVRLGYRRARTLSKDEFNEPVGAAVVFLREHVRVDVQRDVW